MIYLTTDSDGGNTEGIGAMVQYQMFCYCLAKQFNVGFCFSGFKNFTHWQYYPITQEQFMEDVNRLFIFPTSVQLSSISMHHEKISVSNVSQDMFANTQTDRDIIVNVNAGALMRYGQENIAIIEKNEWLKQLESTITLDHDLIDPFYKKGNFNIAVHIRKYTKTDCDPAGCRDLYDASKNTYYNNLITCLLQKYEQHNPKIHIYAQGMEEEYTCLLRGNSVKLHIEEYPLVSLYHMIKSDIFIMSNSSLSYIASLYRQNITYKKHHFYHTTYKGNMNTLTPEGILL